MNTQGAVTAPITCQNLAEMVEPEMAQIGTRKYAEMVTFEKHGVSINQTSGATGVSQVSKMQALQSSMMQDFKTS